MADERATVAALDTRGTVAAVATALGVTIEPLGEGPTQASDLGPATMGEVLGLAWDAAGETLAVGTDTSRTRLRNRRGEARGEFDARTPRTHRLLWAPTAPLLATNCDDVAICVWTIPREADQPARLGAVLSAHREAITALAWSPDSRRLASAATDGTLKVWAVQGDRGRTILRSPDPAPLADLDVSSDGQWLAASDDAGRIVVWSTKSGAVAAVLRIDEERETTSIRWHPTQPLLAVADVSGTITLFDWPDGRRRTSPKRDERMVRAIRWLPDERALVAATQDGAAVRWDIDASDDRALSELPGRHDEAALVLAVSPAAHGGTPTLLSANTRGVVLSHTQPPATVLSMLAITGAQVSLDSLQFSPAGDRVLVAGNSGDVFVFDWPPGANPPPIRLATNAGMITSAAFSPDGRWVAAIDPGSQLHVWRTADWRPFASVLLRSEIGTTPQDPHGQVGQLRRLTWLGADEIAVATRAGSVQVVSVDLDAWKARVTGLYPVAD